MTDTLIWLHEDALRENHPAHEGLNLNEDGFFVWDAEYLAAMNYGFKRLVFVYETLCELGVPIYEGDTESVALALMRARGATTLRTAYSPNPALKDIASSLGQFTSIVTFEDTSFVTLERPLKLKRFFGYWKKAKPILLRE